MEQLDPKWIAGFWRRSGAILIDLIIIGTIGFLLGLALENVFVQLGGWGRLIGFVIALLYFGILNSKLAHGQTLGKKLLKIKVVNAANEPISIGRSCIRYSIIALPFFLNGAHFGNEAMFSIAIYPLSLIVFGGLLSIVYLFIFNKATRQSLHDLIVGTYVVNSEVARQETNKIWNGHLAIVAIFCLAAAVVPAFTSQLSEKEPFKNLLAVQSALTNEPNISYVNATTGTTYFSNDEGTKETTYVNVQVFLDQNNVQDTELAKKLAQIVMANYADAKNTDIVQVVLTYGYDIGIASQWVYFSHRFQPNEL